LRSEGEWIHLLVPLSELNPGSVDFDRIVFKAVRGVGTVELDGIGLTGPFPHNVVTATGRSTAPVRKLRLVVDCGAPARPISPLIYGITYSARGGAHQWMLGASARRWGGTPTTRFNWEIGHAWNTGLQGFFRNVNDAGDEASSWIRFMDENKAQGVATALTVPIIGWVAKDAVSYSFPVSVFGPQEATAPENPNAGNGKGKDGRLLPPGPPGRTSVPAPPDFVGRWVRAIRQRDTAGRRSVDLYVLDNEPMLWNSTHRDVHPGPTSYDELLQKTVAYGGAVRAADPGATIAGPAIGVGSAYLYSASDLVAGVGARPERRAPGDPPFMPWWLRRLREHSQRTGVRVLDVVDVHFFPQEQDISGGKIDSASSASRILSTRALWDPDHVDESWIGGRIQLIPRLRQSIDENYPGLGISIGEWNFGADGHMSGGLATAEALGRFGALGVRAAFYSRCPDERTPTFWAFRAFRDFDGLGGRFLDWSVRTAGGGRGESLFVSRSELGDRVVAVLLNFEPATALEADIELGTCGAVESRRAFVYSGQPDGFVPTTPGEAFPTGLSYTAPPYSISVLDLGMRPPGGKRPSVR
jgi:hypothetical protein